MDQELRIKIKKRETIWWPSMPKKLSDEWRYILGIPGIIINIDDFIPY